MAAILVIIFSLVLVVLFLNWVLKRRGDKKGEMDSPE